MKVTLDLEEEWIHALDASVAEIIKDELRLAVRSEVRKHLKGSDKVKRAAEAAASALLSRLEEP